MHVRINGETKECSSRTINALLTELSLDPTKVVVEQNGTIVYRDGYEKTAVNENDSFEIVQFVGGG